jgi:hypothetical protein
MTFEQLLSEGRKLERPCTFLRPTRSGPVAAVWYERDYREIDSTGHRCWLTVDAHHIPGLPPSVAGYMSVFTNEEKFLDGRVEVSSSWPKRVGTPLYAHVASVLPPIEAIFLRGSGAVGKWLVENDWGRDEPYNSYYFRDRATVESYEKIWQKEFPIYLESDVYAALGGWHFPWPDGDWYDLIDEQLMVFTVRNSEPWVDAWCAENGEYRVRQRIT